MSPQRETLLSPLKSSSSPGRAGRGVGVCVCDVGVCVPIHTPPTPPRAQTRSLVTQTVMDTGGEMCVCVSVCGVCVRVCVRLCVCGMVPRMC